MFGYFIWFFGGKLGSLVVFVVVDHRCMPGIETFT